MNKYGTLIKVLLLVVGVLFVYSLFDRPPDVDDAWIGEYAYWQSQLGFVKSELMRGITQQEVRFLPHHKLLTLEGAGFIKLFGFSLVTLKCVSLTGLILFLLMFYLYAYRKLLSREEFWLSTLLLLSNAMIFQYSFVFRPEVLLMMLGFISYFFLEKGLAGPKRATLYILLSGFVSGLCVSTHLNGVIFPAAGFLLLVWNRKFLLSFLFGLAALPSVALYFYDFTSTYNFSYWWYQLNQTPSLDRASDLPAALYYLNNLAKEHMRFFHSPEVISFSALLITLIIVVFKPLKAHRNLLRYTLLLVVILGLLAVHKASKYMILYMPYLVLIITLSFRYLLDRDLAGSRIFRKVTYKKATPVFLVLLAIYLVLNIGYDIPIALRKYDPDANRKLVEKYLGPKTDSCRIVAPMTFIFNEIEHFKSIQSELCYTELQKSDPGIYGKGFLELTRKFGTDYIILSGEFVHRLGVDKLGPQDFAESRYLVIGKQEGLLILRRQ